MFKDLFKILFEDYLISEEGENIYSYSAGWKNLWTINCLDKDGIKVKIDFRLAFTNVTEENCVDFIDYMNLLNNQIAKADEYIIVYLGLFEDTIPLHNVDMHYIIDQRYKKVNQIYHSLKDDNYTVEIIRNKYPEFFKLLKPVKTKERLSVSISDGERFGLRSTGVNKEDFPGQPLISIIIPSYNSELIIEQALQSAIVQSYANKEIIIVDGGSTDGTSSIVKKYEDKIDWFNSEPDKNIFDAINKGTYLSKGMYSIFIGSDDLLFPDALQDFVMQSANNGQVDFAYGNYINLHPSGRLNFVETFIKSKHYGKFQIGHPAMFIKKKTFVELQGFNDEYYICADADFELKLITNNKFGVKLENLVCLFRGGGHSSFKMHNVKQVYRIFSKYNALNSGYYYFAAKMLGFKIFILIFGKKALADFIAFFKN